MDIFLVTAPGLENQLAEEVQNLGMDIVDVMPGGVTVRGDWDVVAKANLFLRGATRVLARVAEFRAMHLAQLDKRARKLAWSDWLRTDVPVRVEATCRKSRIYHHKAAAQRIERAVMETVGVAVSKDASIVIKVRIEDDLCTISLDTSGDSLHKRGLKQQVNKAPMRETMAALFLRACRYSGCEPVFDPMCGSGTFPIEAAEIAMNMVPGRARTFAYEKLAIDFEQPDMPSPRPTDIRFFGSDRDQGAIAMSKSNAERAGVANKVEFACRPVSEIVPPCETPGLVIVNPPYGGRVGKSKPLFGLYAALGARLSDHFSGWRVGIVTSESGLARATGLKLDQGPVVNHGGLKVRLYQSDALP